MLHRRFGRCGGSFHGREDGRHPVMHHLAGETFTIGQLMRRVVPGWYIGIARQAKCAMELWGNEGSRIAAVLCVQHRHPEIGQNGQYRDPESPPAAAAVRMPATVIHM
jgi:hypothetical protein